MAKKKAFGVDPSIAITEAFKAMDTMECANLARGQRVEDVLSFNCLMLDIMTGGGVKRGRMATFFGEEAVGKSTALQEAAVAAQRIKIPVMHYDPETGADPLYMENQGLNVEAIRRILVNKKRKNVPGYFYSQPATGEDTYRHILMFLKMMPDVKAGLPTVLILLDSYASMMSEEAFKVDAKKKKREGDTSIASAARMHSRFLPMIRNRIRRKGAVLIASNQVRTDIGSWGTPEKETGGKAVRYYADYRIFMTRKYKLQEDKMKLLQMLVNCSTLKNRVFPPHQVIKEMAILIGRGYDKAVDTALFGERTGLITKTSSGLYEFTDTDMFPDTKMTWRRFRKFVERTEVRKYLFELLEEESTFDAYFNAMGNANFRYDQEEEVIEEEEIDEEELKEEAEEHKETQKRRRKKGKRARGESKKVARARAAIDEELEDEE